MIRRIISIVYRGLKDAILAIDNKVFTLPTKNKKDYDFLIDRIINQGIPSAINFDFEKVKKKTLSFVENMRVNDSFIKYKFAPSQQKEDIYSSTYACLIYAMYGEIDKFTDAQKQEWVNYFNSFQNPKDGLWYDLSLKNPHYNDSDWWGARHLAIHIISAYSALGAKPKYKLSFVEKYYDKKALYAWLDSYNWNGFFDHDNDIDNKIMNIGVIMQYNRDYWGDEDAKEAIDNLVSYLDSKINPITGMWGRCDISNKYELSRAVQFAYHLLRLYFYDNREIKYGNKIIDLTLKTQNLLGGYGVQFNSSACEDMDSIDLLVNLSNRKDLRVVESLKKALVWVLSNQNEDGGFVFRRNESFWYGHERLRSNKNESNMFATWFRTLALVKLTNFLNIPNQYRYERFPGF